MADTGHPHMPTAMLGRGGPIVSRLALGTMTFGVETDEATAHAQLDRFTAADAERALDAEELEATVDTRTRELAGENLARSVRGAPLKSWTHTDKGTLVSVGEVAVAHGVDPLPIETFGGFGAKFLKKAVAARWIADVSSYGRALDAWSDM